MITREEGKNIAGQILIKELGREYLIARKERLSTTESLEKSVLQVNFYCDEVGSKNIATEDGGIHVDDSYFPEHLLSVKVDLNNGKADIMKL